MTVYFEDRSFPKVSRQRNPFGLLFDVCFSGRLKYMPILLVGGYLQNGRCPFRFEKM